MAIGENLDNRLDNFINICKNKLENSGCKIIRMSHGSVGLHVDFEYKKSGIVAYEFFKYPWEA